MNKLVMSVKRFFRDRFNLDEDKAEEEEIVANIQRNVHFKGTNVWTLIFAIMVASIGLNVNSTAVIIGAMLISPLMGPLMGIGLSIGTNDLELLRKGIKNLAIAAVISILTSAFYFFITPLQNVNSELLARTNPSLWDVFIAFFGGMAGIVAGTRTNKSTAIPGVAIATALMPPLCTAGFGLATGNWDYLLGALYLFFINSLFICLATFLIVRRLKFHKKEFQTKSIEKRVIRTIWIVVILTLLPSIFLAYKIVQHSIFENNAKTFVQNEFNFSRTQVISRAYKINRNKKSIELLLMGDELSPQKVDSLRKKMSLYHLYGVKLIVHQGLDAKKGIDMAQIKASILEEVFKKEPSEDTLTTPTEKIDQPLPDLRSEIKSLYPDLQSYSLSNAVLFNIDSTHLDTITLVTVKFKRRVLRSSRIILQNWLKARLKADSVRLFFE